jgi:hypothetical protein
MRNLIFILISCLAFAQEPQKPDTSKLPDELKTVITKAENEIQKAEILDKKISLAEKENSELRSLYNRFRQFLIENFKSHQNRKDAKTDAKAIKEDNRTDPVQEIEVFDGQDSIRGGWLYRLFHKNDYYFKRYKIENNEKVYLD